jgi:hypothetical protein
MLNSNHFSSKFVSKSNKELETIISSGDKYQEEARLAAKWELEKRTTNGTLQDEPKAERIEPKGEARYS